MSYPTPMPAAGMTDSLQKSWRAVTANIWPFIGFTILFYVATGILQKIPGIGSVVGLFSFIYTVCLFNGFDAIDRHGALTFSDFFSWSPKFGKLLGANLVLLLIGIAIFLPVIILSFQTFGTGIFGMLRGSTVYLRENMAAFSRAPFVIAILLSPVLAFIYLMLSFSYLFLILFKDLSIADALRLSWNVGRNNIGALIAFIFLAVGVVILGALALLVGLLVALPVISGMQYYFLRSIFPQSDTRNWDFMQDEPKPEIFS